MDQVGKDSSIIFGSRTLLRAEFCNVLWCTVYAASLSLVVWTSTATAAQAPLATISVKTEPLRAQIPKGFVGLSLEVSPLGEGFHAVPQGQLSASGTTYQYALGRADVPNKAYFQFMRNLGPGVLRLGGGSQDNTCWDPNTAPHPDWCAAPIKAGDLKLFSLAAQASGWRLVLGLNLKQDSAAWALREITQGITRYIKHGQILGLEIGNEPELFSGGGFRPNGFTVSDHARSFLSYAETFRNNPVAKQYQVVGPAYCCAWRDPRDLNMFIMSVSAKNLALVTVHAYSASTAGERTVTIAQLLEPALMDRWNEQALGLVAAAHENAIPIALAESNSVDGGGMPGVSDAFASALWGLDWMFSAAYDGFSQINFHTSYKPGGSPYNPIVTVGWQDRLGKWRYRNTPQPLYYAMYMFARNATGEHFLPVSTETRANVRTYAVSSCAGCEVKVFIVNKDLTEAGTVCIHIDRKMGKGSLILFEAPHLDSTASSVRYGGVQFDPEGRLPAPHANQVRSDANGEYRLILPNSAAAMLIIAPLRMPKRGEPR